MSQRVWCHSKLKSKKQYFIWFTVICYTIGAYVIYNSNPSVNGGAQRIAKKDDRSVSSNGRPQAEGSKLPPANSRSLSVDQDRKRILFWTAFHKDYSLEALGIRRDTLATCPFKQCEFTFEKSRLNSSHAVIFHGRDLQGTTKQNGSTDGYIDLPKFRSEKQLWVFFMLEAPVHTVISLEPFDHLFNMTMTYRKDSDIYMPYGRVRPIQKTGRTSPNLNKIHRNTTGSATEAGNSSYSTKSIASKRPVAWSVSNCYNAPSRRNEVVHELHKYIPIDVYGDCGPLKCPPRKDPYDSGLECHRYLAENYKFYLAFENALCEDYITEKFYDSLYTGMVPIVYGGGDYSKVAPKGSFIDATVFPTMKSLASHLLYLDEHPTKYLKYLEWREKYEIQVSFLQEAWCTLCTKLWGSVDSKNNRNFHPGNIAGNIAINNNKTTGRPQYIVQNLSDWWLYRSSNGSRSSSHSTRSASAKMFTISTDAVHLKMPACMHPKELNWDPNIFSIYGFMYYPNYSVKMRIIYAVVVFGIIFAAFFVKCLLVMWKRRRP